MISKVCNGLQNLTKAFCRAGSLLQCSPISALEAFGVCGGLPLQSWTTAGVLAMLCPCMDLAEKLVSGKMSIHQMITFASQTIEGVASHTYWLCEGVELHAGLRQH